MAVDIQPGPIAPFKTFKNKFAMLPGRTGEAQTECFTINFELASGGMGDYICWTPALQWIVKNCPWVHGRIWAPAYFISFMQHVFKDVPNWEVHLIEKFSEADKGTLCRGLQSTPGQLINATGCGLIELGFMYFANLSPMPPDTVYPQLDLRDVKLHKKLRGLEKKYVVFTPGGTTQSRFVPAKHWNPLIDWVIAQGLTPVFLGKGHLADVHKSYFDDETHYEKGIDLREQTSLLEAARIIKESLCIIGLDNGLLHLAACTDASIVFGYNIAAPVDRRPLRPSGKLIEITVPEERLGCIHCQTKFKLLYTHNYKNCIYKDVRCIDLLFENEGERWKQAITEIQNDTHINSLL